MTDTTAAEKLTAEAALEMVERYAELFVSRLVGAGDPVRATSDLRREISDRLNGRTWQLINLDSVLKQSVRAIMMQRQPGLLPIALRHWEESEATARRHYATARDNLVLMLTGEA